MTIYQYTFFIYIYILLDTTHNIHTEILYPFSQNLSTISSYIYEHRKICLHKYTRVQSIYIHTRYICLYYSKPDDTALLKSCTHTSLFF